MKNSLLIVDNGNEEWVSGARTGMKAAFPGSDVRVFKTLDDAAAIQTSNDTLEMLCLLGPSDEDTSRAADVLDAYNLPRFGVVVCSDGGGRVNVEAVKPGEWTTEVLAHVFRLGAARHFLLRENEAFRGYLLSISTKVAHDLRSPLGGILSAAEALSEYLAEKDPSEVGRVQAIIESEEELLKLIRHMTMLTGELARPLLSLSFEMATAVAGAVETLEGKIAKARATIITPGDWPTVEGDQKKIERVWTLMIENSLRHAGTDKRIELGWDLIPQAVRFWVKDDGRGVPRDRQGLLFRPFHRLHEPNSAKGLSLSLVERLVHQHGGNCGYVPQPGGNPLFFFTIPA